MFIRETVQETDLCVEFNVVFY